MILEISSDLDKFKNIRFKDGLNIIVAERHKTSTQKDTRNGTGKTSIIELLHYLFQEKKNKEDDFHNPKILGSRFAGIFEKENGTKEEVSRVSSSKKDLIYKNDVQVSAKDLQEEFSLEWFGLTKEDLEQTYSPKFKPLFSYFARKSRNGAFQDALQIEKHQKPWDSQINLAYLLGFEWKLIQKLQNLKDEKKRVDALNDALAQGIFGDYSLADMQAELDKLEGEAKLKREQVATFTVIDGYKVYEDKANELTQEIKTENEENLIDKDLIANIEDDFRDIDDMNINAIRSSYKEIEFYFPEKVEKRFEDVENFHRAIIRNRKYNLEMEREAAVRRIQERREKIQQKQFLLQENMAILSSGGALERYTALQAELNKIDSKMNHLKIRIPEIRETGNKREALKREIADQMSLIGRDIEERDDSRKFATQAFAEASQFLYERSGTLSFDRSRKEGGLEISLKIEEGKSQGKSKMQIFCFDWVLVQASKRQGKFPGFLVHDSDIFDGVDSRQISRALQFADKKCREIGSQYIVTINSDDLNKAKSVAPHGGIPFDLESSVVMRLDDSENGGLFGQRLEDPASKH